MDTHDTVRRRVLGGLSESARTVVCNKTLLLLTLCNLTMSMCITHVILLGRMHLYTYCNDLANSLYKQQTIQAYIAKYTSWCVKFRVSVGVYEVGNMAVLG